jgi:hypothetical protein
VGEVSIVQQVAMRDGDYKPLIDVDTTASRFLLARPAAVLAARGPTPGRSAKPARRRLAPRCKRKTLVAVTRRRDPGSYRFRRISARNCQGTSATPQCSTAPRR